MKKVCTRLQQVKLNHRGAEKKAQKKSRKAAGFFSYAIYAFSPEP
jgi:hypothetical protein